MPTPKEKQVDKWGFVLARGNCKVDDDFLVPTPQELESDIPIRRDSLCSMLGSQYPFLPAL